MGKQGVGLPIVLLSVGNDERALDVCLAALEAATPAGTRVWLADNAQAGPRVQALLRRWLAQTGLQAAHTRRSAAVSEAAHLGEALQACGDAEVVVLAADARPTPGWLQQLQQCLHTDPQIATVTPWCNAGECAAWPRIGEVNALAVPAARLADACAALPDSRPELPAAGAHAVLLRGDAVRAAGGIDAASYASWCAGLQDLSRRLVGLGQRNVLCARGFVLRDDESRPQAGDMQQLAVRWPGLTAQLAQFLMQDPLRDLRTQLAQQLQQRQQQSPQTELFAGSP